MFIGKPPGNYDRLLDFSRAVTGTLFFVPSATFLDALGDDASTDAAPAAQSTAEPAADRPRRRTVRSESAPSKEKRAHE